MSFHGGDYPKLDEFLNGIEKPIYKPEDDGKGDLKWILIAIAITFGGIYLLGSLGNWLF